MFSGVGDSLETPLTTLTTEQATATAGQAVFVERDAGHCVLCHRIDSLSAPFQGDLGPVLTGVGSRLSPAQIRFRLVDPSRLNPDTIMPSYFKTGPLHQLPEQYKGKPILDAYQIEQLVIYLSSLKG
ncbi:sulfur oxidation c-type cytochrome SoxX [Marinobacter alexandrii]|uniref:sulfur oxidation c-type cytochrome SoxX n=1 Tax=Marinobacter alexandrii TaxID=2570351 RepID=UPI003D663266